jgi:hypothetical protein
VNQLQKEWYRKLKESGFNDIEENFQYHSSYFWQAFTTLRHRTEDRVSYHDKAFKFLNLYDFDTEQDREIWFLHCEGISQRKIAQMLDVSKGCTYRTIKRLTAIMLEAIL